MNSVKRIILVAACLMLGACGSGGDDPGARTRGAARIALFKECMTLAAKMPRLADDNVAEIVSQCSNQAYYMTNHLQ